MAAFHGCPQGGVPLVMHKKISISKGTKLKMQANAFKGCVRINKGFVESVNYSNRESPAIIIHQIIYFVTSHKLLNLMLMSPSLS